MMKLALIGDPVSHSRSPQIHRKFLREAEIDGDYAAIRVPRGNGIDVIHRMRVDGYTGINITFPLKEEVLAVCDELDEDARVAGAVNTIYFGDCIYGANTDGLGARTALEQLIAQPIALERVGVLGTGATARAILAQLRETDAYAFVWGRDPQKVRKVCERFEAKPWPLNIPEIVISTLPPDARLDEDFVNALQRADIIFDCNYGSRSTLAGKLHREVTKGDSMLEAQARASFDFWLAHLDRVAPEPVQEEA